MSTSARRTIEDDLARIRAGGVSDADVPAGDVTRTIEGDLAEIRQQGQRTRLRQVVARGAPPIAAEASRVVTPTQLERNAQVAEGESFPRRLIRAAFQMAEGGPLTAAQMAAAPATSAANAARFIGQSAAETTLPPDVRARALADPNRISEADAALSGVQIALPSLPVTGVIGRALIGAGTGAAYTPEDPGIGAVLGGAAGAAGAKVAGERLAPGIRILRPIPPAPETPPTRPLEPSLPPGSTAQKAGEPPIPDAEFEVVSSTPLRTPERLRLPAPKVEGAPGTPVSGSASSIEGARRPAAPEPPREIPPIEGHAGAETQVLLKDGKALPAQYRVVSLKDLQPSHNPFTFQPNPLYPGAVQGRDYQRNKATQMAVQLRALRYDPNLALNPSQSAAEGPPTILPSGIVLAGNERSMLPQLAAVHAPEKYAAYLEQLKARAAAYGIDPKLVETTDQPVLVRQLTDPADVAHDPKRWQEINRLSDEVATKAKSSIEEGAARAQRLAGAPAALEHFGATIGAEDTIAGYLEGKEGKAFARKLIDEGVISAEEFGKLTNERGELTEDGRTAVRRMMLGAAVGDPAAIADAPASILDKLEHAVPAIVSVRGSTFDVSAPLAQALQIHAEAKAKGMTLADLRSQATMFAGETRDPRAEQLADFLATHKKAEIKEAFRRFGVVAREAIANAGTVDMFGGTGYTPERAFQEAFGGRPAGVREQLGFDISRAGETRARAQAVLRDPHQLELARAGKPTLAYKEALALVNRGGAIGGEEMAARQPDLAGPEAGETRNTPGQLALFEPVLAYHGTPHRFEKFSLAHVGTGEGHQAYGWGLYFAGNKEVAKYYRAVLSERREGAESLKVWRTRVIPALKKVDDLGFDSPGQALQAILTHADWRTRWDVSGDEAYEIDGAIQDYRFWKKEEAGSLFSAHIGDDAYLMDWDATMAEQPPAVQAAIAQLASEIPMVARWQASGAWPHHITGKGLYQVLEGRFQDQGLAKNAAARATSEKLAGLGITGHRYLDDGSRGVIRADEGKYYVAVPGSMDRGFDTRKEAEAFARELRKRGTHNYVIYDDAHIQVRSVEERARTSFDPHQQNLFTPAQLSVPEPERAFGSATQAEAAAARVEAEAGNAAMRATSEARIRGVRQPARSWVDIRGQRIKDLETLHRTLTPFRDPKVEQLGAILLDADDRVVSHTLETSGAINYVAVRAGTHDRVTDAMFAQDRYLGKWAWELVRRARRAGVTRVMFHHNHPSGDPTPSEDDLTFTRWLAVHLARKGIEVVAHYVIDHTKGTFFRADGSMVPVDIPEPTLGPGHMPDWTAGAGVQLKSLNDLGLLISPNMPIESLSVAYMNSQNRLVALEPHANDMLDRIGQWLPQRVKAHGAASAVLLVPAGAISRVRLTLISSTAGQYVVDVGTVEYDADDIPRVLSLSVAGHYRTRFGSGPIRTAHRVFEQGPDLSAKKRQEEFNAARAAGIRSGLSAEQANAYAAAAKDIDFDGAKQLAQEKLEAGGLRAKLRRWADAAADQTKAIDRASRKAVERGMPPELSPEYQLALSYNSDDTIRRALYDAPEMATTHGILDPITREPMGPTLESVVKPLGKNPEKVRQAFTYVVALRKVGRGLAATAGDEGELNAAIAAVDALGKVPLYRQFSKDLEAHLDALGTYAVRSGLWDKATWEALKASDLFYVPFRRLMTHIEPPKPKQTYGTRRANVTPGIQSFEGSRRFLANPVEAVAGYDAAIIRRADAYRVGSAVIDALTQYMGEEGKAILTPLAADDPAVKAFTASQVRRNLSRSGLSAAEVGMVADLSAPMIDPHNPVVWRHSKTTGAKEYFLLNEPELYKALVATRADSPLGHGALMAAFRMARRIMTVTATGINPRFALGLNIARDVPQAIMQNKGIRADDVAVAALEALKAVVGRSDFADLLARHGLGSASIYAHAIDAEAAARRLAPVTRGQKLRTIAAKAVLLPKAFELAERGGAASDLVGRFAAARAVQRRALKAGKTPRGAAALAATAGVRATVNFNRRAGKPALQFLEQTVPFFGAAVRSALRAGEAVGEVPGRVAGAIAVLALAILAEWLYTRKDKEARARQVDRPATERSRFITIGGVRYPLPQEMAVIAAGIRSALAQFTEDDPDHADQLREAVYNLLPPVLSDLVQWDFVAPWPGVREIQEVARNKQAYGQRPIVPERLRDLPPAMQRYETTSPTFDVMADAARKFAVVIPGLGDATPLGAEHIARGFLGNMTPLLTAVTDAALLRTAAGKALPPEIPVPLATRPLMPTSAFVVRDPPARTSSENWYYRREREFNEGRAAATTVRKMEDQATTPTGRLRVEGAKARMGGGAWALSEDQLDDVRTLFKETDNRLKEYRTAETEIRQRVNDGALEPTAARQLLDALTLERQSMFRQVRAALHGLGVPQ